MMPEWLRADIVQQKTAGGAMRKIANVIMTGTATVLLGLGSLLATQTVSADDGELDAAVCNDKANPPKDAVTQGFCIAIDRKKGNCNACHAFAGVSAAGNIAPPLVAIKQRFPDKAKIREQIWDSSKANPNSVMPPFGKFQILTPDEIDKVVEFVDSL
jgi:L-cysteine S-thiosulfotransferase